ncbi:bacteriohemerythrin [Ferrovum sp. PN-J185]|uniref:bacteriohemerythrin n=1 Tax=Ferrovum sp. PN-J185 TaxID=1356306 RepID=UPI00079A49C6|nr:bacteriohemerythrin [Ferrovum sp. PN-J185]KXW56972.1 cyclic di-GMP phosphodiesterase response regulator RpfG [Ferrovum sp. PN-J185]MCC6069155.1 bacteriohemerythrin [Ferrovum sp. PN-J185]
MYKNQLINTKKPINTKKSVDIFPWNEYFKIGIEEIDKQHEKLVGILNEVATHVSFNSKLPELQDIIEKLVDYTQYHFKTEESLWEKYLKNDSSAILHKKSHDRFIEKINAIKLHADNTPTENIINDLLGYLTNWLVEHILEHDRELSYIVYGIQCGLTIEEAKINADKKTNSEKEILIKIILSMYDFFSINALTLIKELSHKQLIEETLLFKTKRDQLVLELSKKKKEFNNIELFINYIKEKFITLTKSKSAFIVIHNKSNNQFDYYLDYIKQRDTIRNHESDEFLKEFSLIKNFTIEDNAIIINELKTYKKEQNIHFQNSKNERIIIVPMVESKDMVTYFGVLNKEEKYTDLDLETAKLLANESWYILENELQNAKQDKLFLEIVNLISTINEFHDQYTVGHESRVSNIAIDIAKKLNLDKDTIMAIKISALLHDIGKITVPQELLNKSGKISNEERDILKSHVNAGYNILKNISFPWPIADIVYQHHERLNGSGYPEGKHSGDILIEAKIIAVADVYESMATNRPYRQKVGHEKALEELIKGKGILYDSIVVDTLLSLVQDIN